MPVGKCIYVQWGWFTPRLKKKREKKHLVLRKLGGAMGDTSRATPKLPPAWFKPRSGVATGLFIGRVAVGSLWTPRAKAAGVRCHLTAIGRNPAATDVSPRVSRMARTSVRSLNGWDEGYPSWWLSLEGPPRRGPPWPSSRARSRAATGGNAATMEWVDIGPETDTLPSALSRHARRRARTGRRELTAAVSRGDPVVPRVNGEVVAHAHARLSSTPSQTNGTSLRTTRRCAHARSPMGRGFPRSVAEKHRRPLRP